MSYLNPNKYLKAGIINTLKLATGLGAWYSRIPISTSPLPNQYIILNSQTKNEYAKSKDCFEWMCTIDVNIYGITTYGNSNMAVIDDIEQKVINALKSSNFKVTNFYVKNVDILESLDLSADLADKSKSVDRRLIKFDIWLNNVDV